MVEEYDVVVVGSGVSGLTAAIYCARYNLKTLVIGKDYGLLAEAHAVENWPGIKSIPGLRLVQNMIEHTKSLGVKVSIDEVEKLKKENEKFSVFTKMEKQYSALTLILAMGLAHRKLNIPGEQKLLGKGVSYCATCDAPFTRGKVCGVIGGSDSAAMAALLAAEYAEKVFIFYRRMALRAQPYLVDQIKKNKKIETVFNSNVIEVLGDKDLEKVKVDIKGKVQEMPLGFLIIEIGAVPHTALLKDLKVKTNEWGFIDCDREQKTSVEAVFACGDINANIPLRQAITAAGEGSIAANSVYECIKKLRAKQS